MATTATQAEAVTIETVRNRDELAILWPTLYPSECAVVEFYGHSKKSGRKACFSNFYRHDSIPFTVPDCCWDRLVSFEGLINNLNLHQTVYVNFSEKSIMLCKAAVMGDVATYSRILAAKSPGDAKRLGRKVTNFDEELWQSVVIRVAFESVYQKFLGLSMESNETVTLMKTSDALIVEAAPEDRIWGVGRPCRHPDCQDPRLWGSGNVLGYALMKARNLLRQRAT